MAAMRKFMFDTSFDTEPEPDDALAPAPDECIEAARSEPPPPAISEADLEAARAEGFAAGLVEGEQSVVARMQVETAATLARIADQVGAAAEEMATIGPRAEERATAIGLAVARKLMPQLVRREGLAEVEAMLRDCLKDMFDEPRIVLRVGDALLDAVTERLTPIVSRSGFAGRVIVIAEEGMATGDCRIEWADGGAERSAARIWREIDAAVARCLETSLEHNAAPAA